MSPVPPDLVAALVVRTVAADEVAASSRRSARVSGCRGGERKESERHEGGTHELGYR